MSARQRCSHYKIHTALSHQQVVTEAHSHLGKGVGIQWSYHKDICPLPELGGVHENTMKDNLAKCDFSHFTLCSLEGSHYRHSLSLGQWKADLVLKLPFPNVNNAGLEATFN